jgi:DNA-binding NtrC family response regulator
VRELKNVMDYVAAVVIDAELQAWHLPGALGTVDFAETAAPDGNAGEGPATARDSSDAPADSPSEPSADAPAPVRAFRSIAEELAAIERQRMLEALASSGGNRTQAARRLQMPLRTFVTRCKQYGIGGSREPGR